MELTNNQATVGDRPGDARRAPSLWPEAAGGMEQPAAGNRAA
jgi:hypothetical protein